jgi:hypothetical protein
MEAKQSIRERDVVIKKVYILGAVHMGSAVLFGLRGGWN